jgi:hypothetical protein
VASTSTLLVLTSGVVASLLWYYRPGVEYALVFRDREGPTRPVPSWILPSVPLAAVAMLVIGYLLLTRHARR